MGNRDIAAAWRYHDGTKHSFASLRRDPGHLDWQIKPLSFKVYTGLDPIPLAGDLHSSVKPALAAIGDLDEPPGPGPPIDLDLLAHLFHFSAGVLRRRSHPAGDAYFRAAACTGNLHHIDLYLACGALPDLAAGVYHFSPHDFALRRLRAGDHRAHLVEATGGEPRIADAPAVLVFASTFWRNAWKYRARAWRHCFWDSGTLLANLLALCAARSLPAHLVLGFVDDALDRLLDLDSAREATLGLVALGRGGLVVPAPAAPPVAPLDYETLLLSEREVDYPSIREAHAASSLGSAAEVVDWRRPLGSPRSDAAAAPEALPGVSPVVSSGKGGGPPGAAGAGARPMESERVPLAPPAPPTGTDEPIEAVILRRGSTRVFAREAISFEALSTILRVATCGIPADFLEPGAQRADLYLGVHAVAGLAPGAYWLDRDAQELVLLRPGSFRREAGQLGLGQEIPADASVDIFWLTDLGPLLERLGNRGYRAAQLEAAIGGGKTYLAAYALRLGASGLTFFDDDVTSFFSPHAARKSVMFLMAVGLPRRQRREPAAG